MLLKTALKRGAMSFFIGIGVSQLINIVISLGEGRGAYLSVLPRFAALFSSDLAAVAAQALLTGLLGFTFAASSVFFMIEAWSFLRQCAAHFLVTSAVWLSVVLLVWTPFGQAGVWITLASFLVTYLAVWLSQVIVNRRIVRRINGKLNQKESSHERD